MIKYYRRVNKNPEVRKVYDIDRLLDDCYKMVNDARARIQNRDYPIHIVLPVDDLRILRYALAKDRAKEVAVTGSLHPYTETLFGAILHESILIAKPFVF